MPPIRPVPCGSALAVAAFALALAAAPVRADDSDDPAPSASEELAEALGDFDDETALGGFDDETELGGFDDEGDPPLDSPGDTDSGSENSSESGSPLRGSFWELSGNLQLGIAVNYLAHESTSGTDYGGLSRLRGDLNLQLDLKLFYGWQARISARGFYDAAYLANGFAQYTSLVLDQYESLAELQEFWIQGSLHKKVDLKLGRQIVNWGRSDILRVLDVLNPLDEREPGLADLEDLRLPVAMAKLDGYHGPWTLSGMWIPEVRFSDRPVYGSDFYPLPCLDPSDPPESCPVQEDLPDHFSDSSFAGAISGIFRGFDASLHVAYYWERLGRLRIDTRAGSAPGSVVFRPDRLILVGGGANATWGNWLFKTELAWINGFHFENSENPGETHWRFDAMLGVEYYGFDDTVIALEVVNRHQGRFQQRLEVRPDLAVENRLEASLRAQVDLLHARLHLSGLGLVLASSGFDGGFARLEANYDLRDALTLGAGVILYFKGDLIPFGRNDRVFGQIRWSF